MSCDCDDQAVEDTHDGLGSGERSDVELDVERTGAREERGRRRRRVLEKRVRAGIVKRLTRLRVVAKL